MILCAPFSINISLYIFTILQFLSSLFIKLNKVSNDSCTISPTIVLRVISISETLRIQFLRKAYLTQFFVYLIYVGIIEISGFTTIKLFRNAFTAPYGPYI